MGTLDYRGVEAEAPHAERCPECGYCLTGLPAAGRCPECGDEYSPERMILWGWAKGLKVNLANTPEAGMVSLSTFLFSSLPMLWGFLLYSFFRGRLDGIALGMVLAVPVGMSVYRLYRYRRNTAYAPQPTQVRLCPEGFGQRDGVGSVKLTPWETEYRIKLGTWGKHYRLRIHRGWLAFTWANPVDLEFECDVETARRVREHIDWCQAASKR